jgi:hypothetical protein
MALIGTLDFDAAGILSKIAPVLKNGWIWAGLVSYGLSLVLWLLVLIENRGECRLPLFERRAHCRRVARLFYL